MSPKLGLLSPFFGAMVAFAATPAHADDIQAAFAANFSFDHIAVANPPYGAAAIEAMKAIEGYEPIAPKMVQGENIAQTDQFVSTGNALLGFVALSQIFNEGGKAKAGSTWVVPELRYAPTKMPCCSLKARTMLPQRPCSLIS